MDVARDVREGQRWSLLQRAKNDAIYIVAMTALAIASRLPPALARAGGRALAFLAWALLAGPRRIAIENVRATLSRPASPDLDDRAIRFATDAPAFVRRVYRQLGDRLADAVVALRAPPAPLPFVPGARAVLDAAIAEGNGVVFASAHLGPWEHVAASLVAHGVPLTIVAREPYDPRFARLYARLRQGIPTVYRGASGAGVALVRALRRGRVLGIPMDLASRAPSVTVPFLDRPARTPVGPARLAIRTGAAVVVGTATPAGLDFERIGPADQATDRPEDETELTARINAALSKRIRAWPEAWLWMHDRWSSANAHPLA